MMKGTEHFGVANFQLRDGDLLKERCLSWNWLSALGHSLLCVLVTDSCAAQTNWALRTSTTNQVVEVADSPALQFGTNFTLEAWVNISREVTDRPWEPRVAVGRPNPDGSKGIWLGIETPFFVFRLMTEEGTKLDAFSSVTHGVENWVHMAGSFDGRAIRLYLNGTRYGDHIVRSFGQVARSNQPFLFGGMGPNATTGQWLGAIDEVRIWRRTLSKQEIRSRMWTKFAGDEPGLVGYWNFDDGDATDRSEFGNHGVLHGDVEFVESGLFLASRPRLSPAGFAAGRGFEILLPTETGVDYGIEASEDFRQWEDLGTVQGDDSVIRFSDQAAPSFPRRFYRADVIFTGPREND